jgi:hypothetical protein
MKTSQHGSQQGSHRDSQPKAHQASQAGKPHGHGQSADPHAPQHVRSMQDEGAPLPHETDQHAESQHEDEPRGVGKQAHRDMQRGLTDTDRRGGDEYQQKTQNDAHSNANSAGKTHHARRGKH